MLSNKVVPRKVCLATKAMKIPYQKYLIGLIDTLIRQGQMLFLRVGHQAEIELGLKKARFSLKAISSGAATGPEFFQLQCRPPSLT